MKNFSDPGRNSRLADFFESKRLLALLSAIMFTAFSYRFLDAGISSFVDEFIRANALTHVVSGIPDLLFYFVAFVTAGCWTGYFYLKRRGIDDNHAYFLMLGGTAVPLAFLLKAGFQFLFGRSNPDLCAAYHQASHFHWFRAHNGYGCFPSGHMTVFTAMTMALWRRYPRHKLAGLQFLLALAVALVATNRHFLSDVIAGTYLGALSLFFCDRVLARIKP